MTIDLTLLKQQLGDDRDMKLLTGKTTNGKTVLMTLSKNTVTHNMKVDMTLAVEHHMLCALACLHNPNHIKVDVDTVLDAVGVTLLDNTVTCAVLLN